MPLVGVNRMAWGGRRPGSGRKPKSSAERALTRLQARNLTLAPMPAPGAPVLPVVAVDVPAPGELTEAERAVWERQAPGAVLARTLTPGTAMSFSRYCRLVVLEAAMGADTGRAGGADHRGILQRINTLELQFGCAPCGKPMMAATTEKPANPLDRFLARKREA